MINLPWAIGTFYAVATRDGEALRRSGESFYQYRELTETEPSDQGRLYEVLFADDMWMLVREDDLDFEDE